MPASPLVSVILATHNRRDITVATIGRVLACATPGCELEVIAVDNASTDGTDDAIERRFPTVALIRANANRGSCAKALGVPEARGRFVLFCDDDSYPRPGSIQRMVRHFDEDPRLGAAGFRVHLPDGSQESGALPHMFVGCAVGFRACALQAVGGLDRDLFMQAEEYHLAFRLVNAGWTVRRFDDLHADHLKTPKARRTGRTTFYDTRNNLLLAARYLPPPYHAVYARDWRQRYDWLAQAGGHRSAFRRGRSAATLRGWLNRLTYARARLSSTAMETLFQLDFVARRMDEIRTAGARRIMLADLGKNVYAYHQGAARTGLRVLAIADDEFAAPGRAYRGTPILTLDQALRLDPDAVVIANMSPVHAERTHRRLARLTRLPLFDWFSRPAAPEPGPDRALRPAAV
ncbi:MAG: glycosyltransferase [Phycisphaerales bacterium]|nr:MAG: glycosyltransferase [Phycisphaerales bacterium]